MSRALVVSILVQALVWGMAYGATYHVAADGSGDFATVQEAIDAATHLDTIELGDGVFRGKGNHDIRFDGKAVLLGSGSPSADAGVIDCVGAPQAPATGSPAIRGGIYVVTADLADGTFTQKVAHLGAR